MLDPLLHFQELLLLSHLQETLIKREVQIMQKRFLIVTMVDSQDMYLTN